MGRGRAKAKQQKVARELKYNSSHMTDLEKLQRELAGGSPTTARADVVDDDDYGDDDYGDDGRWATGGS